MGAYYASSRRGCARPSWKRTGIRVAARCSPRKEAFEFLGFVVAWREGLRSKKWYPHVEPSAKSQAKLRDKVRAVLEVRTRNQAAVAVVRKVNPITRGWANAFHYGNTSHVFGKQQAFVRNRLRRWLWRKYSRNDQPPKIAGH